MAVPYTRTREFRKFRDGIDYARRLVVAGQGLAGSEEPAADAGDFYRAAWVQAVGAVDHWLHAELYRRVAQVAGEDATGRPDRLMRLEIPFSKLDEVRRGSTTPADAVVEHVRARWGDVSLLSPHRVGEALGLVTEKDVWAEAAARINEWHYGSTSHTAQTLKRRYVSITGRRDRIVHDADLLDGDPGRRRPITETDTTEAISWLERIAHAVATVLD
jgi:restriction system protein